MKITVFTMKTCTRCEQLFKLLKSTGLGFKTIDIATPRGLAELRINGVFTLEAPILRVDDRFYTLEDLFEGERLKDIVALGIIPRN